MSISQGLPGIFLSFSVLSVLCDVSSLSCDEWVRESCSSFRILQWRFPSFCLTPWLPWPLSDVICLRDIHMGEMKWESKTKNRKREVPICQFIVSLWLFARRDHQMIGLPVFLSFFPLSLISSHLLWCVWTHTKKEKETKLWHPENREMTDHWNNWNVYCVTQERERKTRQKLSYLQGSLFLFKFVRRSETVPRLSFGLRDTQVKDWEKTTAGGAKTKSNPIVSRKSVTLPPFSLFSFGKFVGFSDSTKRSFFVLSALWWWIQRSQWMRDSSWEGEIFLLSSLSSFSPPREIVIWPICQLLSFIMSCLFERDEERECIPLLSARVVCCGSSSLPSCWVRWWWGKRCQEYLKRKNGLISLLSHNI